MPLHVQDILFSLFSTIDVIAFYRILTNKLTYRFSRRTIFPVYILVNLLWFSCWIIEAFSTGPLPKLILHILFFTCLFLLHKDAIPKKLLWIAIVYLMIVLCEIVIMPVALLVTQTSFYKLTETTTTKILCYILSRTLLLIITEALVRTRKRIFEGFYKDFFSIIFIAAAYCIIITNTFYFGNVYLSTESAITLSFFTVCVISFLAMYSFYKITKKSDEIMTNNLKLQQIEMEHKQNQDMAIVVNDLRALRHDMNNHMSVLQGLLTMEEYTDAKAYLSTITEELTVANSFIFIDNKVLSVLINNKISKARQLGIPFDTELLTNTTPFSDSDLCAVVGNILENAIEASSNCKNPYIYFSMQKADRQLLIQCDNTYSVTPIFEKGNLVTTKADKSYHGIGTKTIRSIVKDYQGTCEFTVDEQFHVTISVPL